MNKISEKIHYVGVNDLKIDLFEGQYKVPNGMSYNSYILLDDKITIMDTVDQHFSNEWLDNIKKEIGDKKPSYLVVQHMEPDHSGSIANFLKVYPETTVVGNDKTFRMIDQFFHCEVKNKLVVKDNDSLSIGEHKLTFVFAPMVH
ncbi:MAG: MBL fold metallo-hydrolase [Mycoplasmoidaceae bacterium]|nr:MBL fold metallo-hydrolase [Mycoplasmoidaceae bacterium]